jgi:hypothetical protein
LTHRPDLPQIGCDFPLTGALTTHVDQPDKAALTVTVPEGDVHAFRNESGQPVSILMIFTPGAPRETYFEGLAEIGKSAHQPTEEEMAKFFIRHDSYFL